MQCLTVPDAEGAVSLQDRKVLLQLDEERPVGGGEGDEHVHRAAR
jgi:hypothetical protein